MKEFVSYFLQCGVLYFKPKFILLLYYFFLFGSPKAALEVVKKVFHCLLSIGWSGPG